MAKERENRKKEKKEKKDKEERKEKKRREAEELEVKEKKISKKRKSESKKPDKSEKPKKKSKKSEEIEEKTPKKSKESKKKLKRSDEQSESEPQTQITRPDDSNPVTIPIATTTTITNNESDSDFEFDKEDIKQLLESYSKEELINLIYKTAEKDSRLISAVLESADRDSTQRNIFVRGLGWDTTHENLKTAFEVYGEIEECSVVMDKDTGRAKGFGFVLFKTRKGAKEALRNPEKRMYNRTVSCNMAVAKPPGVGKPREPVETVKIDLTQSEMALPGQDLAHGHGLDKGYQQQHNMPMYGGQNMPFYGHDQPPGYNPMYGPLMGNQGALMGNQMFPGLQNYRMFGPGMMNQGPPNHMGMAGQYGGEGNGVGPGFDGERAWYMR